MNLKARVHVENQKKEAQARLAARLAVLKDRGVSGEAMQRDAALRKIKAEIRESDFRLASISAQVKLNQDRAQAKIDKIAAEKAAKEAPQEEAPAAPEKKEKKAKKAKAEGQEGGAKPKKEKKEKKEPKEPKEPKPEKEKKEA
jgi:hypothetical protein